VWVFLALRTKNTRISTMLQGCSQRPGFFIFKLHNYSSDILSLRNRAKNIRWGTFPLICPVEAIPLSDLMIAAAQTLSTGCGADRANCFLKCAYGKQSGG
jgi:hypothetical protein